MDGQVRQGELQMMSDQWRRRIFPVIVQLPVLLFPMVGTSLSASSFADSFADGLDRIHKEYSALPESEDVSRLVQLDEQLHETVQSIVITVGWQESQRYWIQEYSQIGVYVGHFSEQLEYSGKLLAEAHKRNPHSPYRKFTLLSAILGDSMWNGEIPDIETAYLYLKEFPDGPHIARVYEILATFYDDLYKVLWRLVRDERDKEDGVYEDMRSFISDRPCEEQLIQAQTLGVIFYEKAIAFWPQNDSKRLDALREWCLRLKMGEEMNPWFWASDC